METKAPLKFVQSNGAACTPSTVSVPDDAITGPSEVSINAEVLLPPQAGKEGNVLSTTGTELEWIEPGSVPFTPASADAPASLAFAEDTDNGAHAITLKAPDAIAADAEVELPGTAGTLALNTGVTANTVLKAGADGNGVASAIVDDEVTVTIGSGASFSASPGAVFNLGASSAGAAAGFRISGVDADNAIYLFGLPAADPHIVGQLYTTAGALMVSAG